MSTDGWIDLQVNGYAGVDFNSDQLTLDDVVAVCQRLADDGVASILATVITAPLATMRSRIARLAGWIDEVPQVAQRIGGIHVEGPFINPAAGFVGAHPVDAVQPATVDAAAQLVSAGGGHVRLFTLAPECDRELATTRWLADQGLVVAAGHCDATTAQLSAAVQSGLRLFTHLGNGCPAMMHRHDNIIQRVLAQSDRLAVSIIADGHHIPPVVLGNFFRSIPDENIVIVSDAISAAGLGPGQYALGDQTVHVDPDGSCWSASRETFAGSASTLPMMHQVLRSLGIAPQQIMRWMRDNPARLLAG